MKRVLRWAPVLLLSGLAFVWWWPRSVAPLPPAQACEAKGCHFRYQGQTAQIHIQPQPRGTRPFRVMIHGLNAASVALEMRMQGMLMPPMRISLLPGAAGVWSVTTFLPVCVAGRRDWLWVLWVDDQALPLALTF